MELMINSPLFGIFLTVITFIIGYEIQTKLGLKFLSPMVTSSVLIIAVLLIFKIPYVNYKEGADILTFFVAPATVVLAIPLYKNLDIIKKYFIPIFLGCLIGISVGAITAIILCNIFGINREILLSMLPKSVTSAIGYEISKKIGAIIEISMVFIVICGIIGYSVGELIFKIFKIDDKIARGVALGSCSHVLGTAKAMELGEVEGSISTVSISISGVLAVILLPLILNFI
ncbi:TIGR00659 family protein [Parvimonas sp. KA00067]|uniref:LrgB family protein n=1 Tax=Parvimonas sp. KA00067 TaxID=1588755 RepID=UPI000795F420|nr:LrgB family protein [Parvimonas sp. KA00067]KXB67686.1 TIGR00659 family protein [Parvimonas sp. KA00067]